MRMGGKYTAYRVAVSLAHLLPPASRISQSLSEVRVLPIHPLKHMLKTAEKSTALEDLWSINPSGALRNPACHVPNLQELSFQWLPQTGHRFSSCGGVISEKQDVLDPMDGVHQDNLPRPHHKSNAEALGRSIVSSFLPSFTIPRKKGGFVCVQDAATGLWRIPIESSMMPAPI